MRSTHLLRRRLLLIALLPMLVIALALSGYFTLSGLAALDQEQTDRGRTIASYLAPSAEYSVIAGDREGLQKLVQSALNQHDIQAVSISDPTGRLLAISGRTALSPAMLLHADMPSTPGLVASGQGWQAFAAPIQRSRAQLEDYLGSTPAQAHPGNDVLGWVFVELGGGELEHRKQEFLFTSLGFVLAGILLAGVLALRLADRVLGPLNGLVAAVRKMADGALDTRVAARSDGEMGELEHGFNDMADRLEDIHRTMQERIDSATAQLSHQARHDALTGLINRNAFEDRAERAVLSARTQNSRHVLCYLDLDQFKTVNDTCGHAAGDELLRQLSMQLRSRLRNQDVLARLGGDEFGVLLENCDQDDALRVAESLRQLVEDFRFFWHDKLFTVGVSIGLVSIDAATHSLQDVLSAADRACYLAKDRGRNRVEVFHPDAATQQRRQQDSGWGVRIREALAHDSLVLYAQPIVPMDDGPQPEIAAEVLLRMHDEAGNLVPPAAFLPAAERFDLSSAVDAWVLEHTLARLARNGCLPGRYAINLAFDTFSKPDFATEVATVLATHRIGAQRLCFELSEAAIGRDMLAAQRFSKEVRALGCSVAVDNFGEGASSFSLLQSLTPDYVKISGSLIRSALDNGVAQTLLAAVAEAAHKLGIGVIAEAIEHPAMRDLALARGIGWGQGRLFAPPAPLDATAALPCDTPLQPTPSAAG